MCSGTSEKIQYLKKKKTLINEKKIYTRQFKLILMD